MAGHRTVYLAYLASPEWQARRAGALERAGHKCEDCAATKRLHVHHLSYRRFRNEPPEDLRVLCRDCHAKKHGLYKVLDPATKRPLYVKKPRLTAPAQPTSAEKTKERLIAQNNKLKERQAKGRTRRLARRDNPA